jgi:DNA-binding response OmpR family regulator
VLKGAELVPLSVTEFRLLHYLMTNDGVAVPTRVILKQVWGYDDPDGTDLVRVTIYRLRRKLEDNPAKPTLVRTVPGVGFMIKA